MAGFEGGGGDEESLVGLACFEPVAERMAPSTMRNPKNEPMAMRIRRPQRGFFTSGGFACRGVRTAAAVVAGVVVGASTCAPQAAQNLAPSPSAVPH
jgi:hypothetical protein